MRLGVLALHCAAVFIVFLARAVVTAAQSTEPPPGGISSLALETVAYIHDDADATHDPKRDQEI